MNDSSTIGHCDISIAGHKEAFLALLICQFLCTGIKRLIFFAFKILSLVGFKHFVGFLSCLFILFGKKWRKHLVCQCLCQIIRITIYCFYLDISIIRVYTKCHVTWQCPRSCRPCQEISIFIHNLKTNNCGFFFYQFIALCHLLCRKRSSTTRTIRHNLKSLVEKAFVPDLL